MGASVHTAGLSPQKWEGPCPTALLEQVGALWEMPVLELTEDSSLGIRRLAGGDRRAAYEWPLVFGRGRHH